MLSVVALKTVLLGLTKRQFDEMALHQEPSIVSAAWWVDGT